MMALRSDCRQKANPGFDKLSLSGGGMDFIGFFPLALSSSKGDLAFA